MREARARRDFGDGQVRFPQQRSGPLHASADEILVDGKAGRLLESSREGPPRQVGGRSQRLDRPGRGEVVVDPLQKLPQFPVRQDSCAGRCREASGGVEQTGQNQADRPLAGLRRPEIIRFQAPEEFGHQRLSYRPARQRAEVVQLLPPGALQKRAGHARFDLQEREIAALGDREGCRPVRQADEQVSRSGEDPSRALPKIDVRVRAAATDQAQLEQAGGGCS